MTKYSQQTLTNRAVLLNSIRQLAKTINITDDIIRIINVREHNYHDLVKDNSADFAAYTIKERNLLKSYGYSNRGALDVIYSSILLAYATELGTSKLHEILSGEETVESKVATAPNRYDTEATGYNTF